jgi:hypothetical protein
MRGSVARSLENLFSLCSRFTAQKLHMNKNCQLHFYCELLVRPFEVTEKELRKRKRNYMIR